MSSLNDNTAKSARDLFASRLGVLAATLGSAVGLGNIWKVPALTGQNGGALFLLIYICSTVLVALPLMITEIVMGRRTRANAYKNYQILSPHKKGWWSIGILAILTAVFILAYYIDVAGWVFAYIPKCFTGAVSTVDPAKAGEAFGALVANPWESLFWEWGVLIFISAIIVRGASGGIEKVTRVSIPLLFLLLVLICIRSVTLPNAGAGLRYLFVPDLSAITGDVILMAMGLSFFKMSIGFGGMITYGSYYQADTCVPALTLRVMFCDLLVSILAGIAVFPAAFSFGFEPTAGTSLLFMTVPAIFASMPGGKYFSTLFFILAATAATGAMLSLLEILVAWLHETFNITRRAATVIMAAAVVVLGLPPVLSMGVWSDVTLFGMGFFDLYDYMTSNIMMPVNGLLTAVFAGYVWSKKDFIGAITSDGTQNINGIAHVIRFFCRYLTPVFIFVILLNCLKIF